MGKTEQAYKFGASRVVVCIGDITTSQAKVIVSSDDAELSMGGGVSAGILRAGGEAIRADAQKKKGSARVGEVVVTTAGKLPPDHVFHAVTISRFGAQDRIDPQDA